MSNLENDQVVRAMQKKCPDLGGFVLRELADAAIETINRTRSLKSINSVTDEEIEAGATALANECWHPPIPFNHLNQSDQSKFKRQANLVLEAALEKRQGS